MDLLQFADALLAEPARTYACAVIDNCPPGKPKMPLVGPDFIWVARSYGEVPTARGELTALFAAHGITVDAAQPIALFVHHDFRSYVQFEDGVEAYEFSHGGGTSYRAFEKADSLFLSHLVGRTFHDRRVELEAVGLQPDQLELLQTRHWALRYQAEEEVAACGSEAAAIYTLVDRLRGEMIAADPKQPQPEVGLPVDQYAIPALLNEVAIRTGTVLDRLMAARDDKREASWRAFVAKAQAARRNR